MSIAEDIIDGWCCQLCGVYFEENTVTLLFAKAATTNYQEEEKERLSISNP